MYGIASRADATLEASGILSLRGTALPYVRLRRVFSVAGQAPKRENIVVVKINEFHAGIAVDELLGGMQTVVKPLGRAFRAVRGLPVLPCWETDGWV